MKKITTLICAILFANLFAFAGTDWYNDFVSINVNSTGSALYWIGSSPGSGTELNSNNFGSVSSLIITGCDMKYWSDTQDRTGGAFYYKIMSADGVTQIVAPVEVIWTQNKLVAANDYQGTITVSIDLLSGLTNNTGYKINVWAKHWGSGQGDNYLSNSSANYVASFTKSVSIAGIEQIKFQPIITTQFGKIIANFVGKAQVQLFTSTGQLISSTTAENEFSKMVKSGVYLLRIDGQSHKVLVQ